MKMERKQYIGIIFSVIVIIVAFFFRNKIGINLFYFISVLSLVISVLPFIIKLASAQGVQKEKDSKFLEFIRDLIESVKTGTPINVSVVNLQNRDYGKLSSHIKKLGNQVSLGIPIDNALKVFAKETKSVIISRAVTLISEAQKAGGEIESILDSVSGSVAQTEEIKKEQKASVSGLISQGYIIFLVFIVIMLVLQYSILPIALDFTGSETVLSNNPDSSSGGSESNLENFSLPLLILLLTQAVFAGLIIGKISEGRIQSGIKHSFILLTITLVIVTGARVII